MSKYQNILEACWVCHGPFPETKGRHRRITCSDRCRQTRHRRLTGQMSWRWKREKKALEQQRGMPFIEREFNKRRVLPVFFVSYKRAAYECFACGEVYVVDRLKNGNPARPYCSDTCEEKSRYQWKKLMGVLEKQGVRESIDWMVLVRLQHNKLSPLCPTCGKPFAPNTTLEGKKLPGRPRKYCSDACRKLAYEHRWKVAHDGRARLHRCRECAECGETFDRTDTLGRRVKRFCGDVCSDRFFNRVKYLRRKAKAMGKLGLKVESPSTGQVAKSVTEQGKNINCDTSDRVSSRAGDAILY